jgi:hypothetical protein
MFTPKVPGKSSSDLGSSAYSQRPSHEVACKLHQLSPQWSEERKRTYVRHGLTLVHFTAQLEPCLTHTNTLHTLNTP